MRRLIVFILILLSISCDFFKTKKDLLVNKTWILEHYDLASINNARYNNYYKRDESPMSLLFYENNTFDIVSTGFPLHQGSWTIENGELVIKDKKIGTYKISEIDKNKLSIFQKTDN